jgi:Flp pilus assembly protein TadG
MRYRSAAGSDRVRGSIAVEYAIVLPMLLLFLLGLVDVGRLFWSYTTLSRSVAAASRCAVVDTNNCATASTVRSYAAGQAWGLGLASSAYTVTTATCGTQIQGTMVFQFFTPWYYVVAPFGAGNTLTLNATACYPT